MNRAATGAKALDADKALAWLRDRGVYVAFVLLVILNLLITPQFATTGTLFNVLVQTAPVLLVSLGMALAIGTEGIDLSVGSVMALASATIYLYLGYGGPVAMVVALFAGSLSGLVAGSLVAFVGVQPLVATLALLVGVRGLAQLMINGQLEPITDPTIVTLGQGTLVGVPISVIIAAAAALIIWFVVQRTTFGRYVVAIGDNRSASLLSGHPVRRTLLLVYIISGMLAALAGIVASARIQASDASNIGYLVELSAIAAVVVGGTPLTGGKVSIAGTVMGALLMQLINTTFVANNLPYTYAEVLTAIIILAAVYIQRGRGAA
jgi:ribose transport system permease protein